METFCWYPKPGVFGKMDTKNDPIAMKTLRKNIISQTPLFTGFIMDLKAGYGLLRTSRAYTS